MRDRTWLEARRAAAQDSTRPTDRLAMTSVLFMAVMVATIVFIRGLLWPMPMPNVSQIINPESGQQPAHVQSGFVQR